MTGIKFCLVSFVFLGILSFTSVADPNPYDEMIEKMISLQEAESIGQAITEKEIFGALLPTKLSKDADPQESHATETSHQHSNPKAQCLLKGADDPRFPRFVDVKPSEVALADRLHFAPLAKFIRGGALNLSGLKSKALGELSDSELKKLVDYLSQIPVEVLWRDTGDHIRSGNSALKLSHASRWTKTNGAGALALLLGVKRKSHLLGKVISFAPKETMDGLRGGAIAVLDVDTMAHAIVSFLLQSSSANAQKTALNMRNMIHLYLEYWAEKSPERLVVAMTSLIRTCKKFVDQNQIELSLKQKGILLGALFSGSLEHAKGIKSQDERRLWIINSVSNLAWAATTFIGAVPLFGTVTSSIAAVLSIGAVTWGVIFNKKGVRDFSPKVKELEGSVEFAVLESADQTGKREIRQDALELLAWMRATIHMNGHPD